MSLLHLKRAEKEINPLWPIWCVSSMYTKGHICKQSRCCSRWEWTSSHADWKRLESLSCSCRKKGECHTLDSSEMLSITSTISWHQDADETASHLQPPPFLRFQDTLCYSSHMQYRVSKCQGMYNNVQWFTMCWGNLCDFLPSFIPGASLFGSISDSTAAGRENFLLQWGCSLTCLGLCHFSIVTGRLPMYWQLSSCNN